MTQAEITSLMTRKVEELLGQHDVSTTICTHVLDRSGRGVTSPAVRL
jgi:hypothetical protein